MRILSIIKRYIYAIVNYKLFTYLNIYNYMNLSRIIKLTLNIRVSNLDNNIINKIISLIFLFCLQKPCLIHSKKSISGFGLKKNTIVGIKVVLRNCLMYEFIGKFLNIFVPKLKQFVGFSKSSFDQFGNYSFGINNLTQFFNISDILNLNAVIGFDLTLTLCTRSIKNSYLFLKYLGFTFI